MILHILPTVYKHFILQMYMYYTYYKLRVLIYLLCAKIIYDLYI